MKRIVISLAIVVLIGISGYVIHARAQDAEKAVESTKTQFTCPMHPEIAASFKGKCPKCGMALTKPGEEKEQAMVCRCPWCMMAQSVRLGKGMGKEMMAMDEETMKDMGLNRNMMMRCRMMMGASMSLTSPEAILALDEELELTAKQVEKLQDIAEEASNAAEDVLSEEQKARLAKLKDTPDTMMGMHQKMMRGSRMMKDSRGPRRCGCCGW